MFVVNRRPDAAELHKFGYAMALGFGILGALLWAFPAWRAGEPITDWAGRGTQIAALCLWALGLILLIVSRLPGPLATPVYVAWMTGATAIGLVMTTLLLTPMFVIMLPVFSLIVRHGDPLRRKLRPEAKTYWETYKPHEPTLERLRRPF